MYALRGLQRLISNKFIFSETDVNKNELKKYRKDGNPVIAFVQDCCDLDYNSQVGTTELYDVYTGYCRENDYNICAKNTFVDQILRNFDGVEHCRNAKIRGLKGLKIKKD